MANWIYNAKQDLIEYPSLLQALENIPNQIKELEEQITSLRGTQYDKTPVQGGMSGTESRLIDYIDRKERLKINLQVVAERTNRIGRGLSKLNDKERRVIDRLVINKTYRNIDRLCEELGYEKAQIYRIQEGALKKFTLSMFGVVDL